MAKKTAAVMIALASLALVLAPATAQAETAPDATQGVLASPASGCVGSKVGC